MPQEKLCPQCGNAILGRSDKRFCSDQCRYLANNARRPHNEAQKFIKRVNAVLRKNRSILKQFSPLGRTTVSRNVLTQAGFDFRHHTQLYRTQKGNTYFFCYDYGYLLLAEEKVLIVNWQPYMDAGSGAGNV